MKYRVSLAILASALLVSLVVAGAEPTPTPSGKPARKLGGGSFGVPPATSPTARAARTNTLAGAAGKTQVDESAGGQKSPRGIVITNESLKSGSATPTPASISITGSAKTKPRVKVPPTPTVGPIVIPEYRDASGRTEADWRRLATIARERIERAETGLAVVLEESKRLENDFYAWSDGNYRERVIRPAWDQAKEKLRLLELEADAARAGLGELEEEARKSGTPPGWLR